MTSALWESVFCIRGRWRMEKAQHLRTAPCPSLLIFSTSYGLLWYPLPKHTPKSDSQTLHEMIRLMRCAKYRYDMRYILKCSELGKILETITYKQWEINLQRGCSLGFWVRSLQSFEPCTTETSSGHANPVCQVRSDRGRGNCFLLGASASKTERKSQRPVPGPGGQQPELVTAG